MAYDSQIIRIKTDTANAFDSPVDIITGGPVTIYSGNTLDIQVGIFNDGALASTTGFATARLEIKPRNPDGTVPDETDPSYASDTISSFDNTLTLTTWKDKTKQHLLFSLTDDETKIPDGNHWVSCYVVTGGGDTVILFAGDFIVKNPGTDAGTPTYIDLGEQYYTAIDSDARFIQKPVGPSDGQILTYDSGTSTWVAETNIAGSLDNIVEDTTPQLGGHLDVNGKEIQSLSATDIKIHSDDDIILELGDASGVKKISMRDSASAEVAYVNSDGGLSCTSASVTGNITVTGNVDGRDLSVDGARLDAMEDAADVTSPTNVAAAGAVMDTDFSTNGVMVRTASGTYVNRTISGTTDQITMTDGDGVSANPYVSIATNPILPGTERVKIPVGTTAERPSIGTEGDLRGNSSTNIIEYYDGFSWVDITAGASGGIAAVQDDTAPRLGNYLDCNAFDLYMDTSTGIKDESGNEQLQFITTGSAVNYVRLTNAATGNVPAFVAAGDDTNISLSLGGKGSGRVKLTGDLGFETTKSIVDANGNKEMSFTTTASAVNYFDVTNAATAGSPTITASGSDTNINLKLLPKGSGVVDARGALMFQTGTGIADANKNESVLFTTTASAVNYINVTNSATTVGPTIASAGDDTNVDLKINSKGTGNVNMVANALTVGNGATGPGEVRLLEDTDNGSNYVGFKAPSAVTTNTSWTLPNGDGTSGQVMQTDASGTLSFATKVAGPGSATDNAIARFDATTGALIQNSTVTLSDTDELIGVSTIQLDTNGGIDDVNGNAIIETVGVASAVNYVRFQNAATANSLQIVAQGSDTNVNFIMQGKNAGRLICGTAAAGTIPLRIYTASQGIDFYIPTITNSRTVTFPDENINLTPATQAEQETGTATDRFVTPGRQAYHASAAKAWVRFTSITTTTITSSFGVTSLTDGGTGITTINFTTAFSASTSYAGVCTARWTSNYTGDAGLDTFGTGSVIMRTSEINTASTLRDMDLNSAVFYGDQ